MMEAFGEAPRRRVPRRAAERRPPRVGAAAADGGRADAVSRGRAPGRDLHARRDGHRGAAAADLFAAVVLTGRSRRPRRRRAPAGAGAARGAAARALLGDGAGFLASTRTNGIADVGPHPWTTARARLAVAAGPLLFDRGLRDLDCGDWLLRRACGAH